MCLRGQIVVALSREQADELCSAGRDLAVNTRISCQWSFESQKLDLSFGDPASSLEELDEDIINKWWFHTPPHPAPFALLLLSVKSSWFFSLAPCSELAGLLFWSLTKDCLKIFRVWRRQIHLFSSRVGLLESPWATGQARRRTDLVHISWLCFWPQEPGSVSPLNHQKGQ